MEFKTYNQFYKFTENMEEWCRKNRIAMSKSSMSYSLYFEHYDDNDNERTLRVSDHTRPGGNYHLNDIQSDVRYEDFANLRELKKFILSIVCSYNRVA